MKVSYSSSSFQDVTRDIFSFNWYKLKAWNIFLLCIIVVIRRLESKYSSSTTQDIQETRWIFVKLLSSQDGRVRDGKIFTSNLSFLSFLVFQEIFYTRIHLILIITYNDDKIIPLTRIGNLYSISKEEFLPLTFLLEFSKKSSFSS